MSNFDLVAIDADDTLWHTEYLYAEATATIKSILTKYIPDNNVSERLYQAEIRNLAHFGYGIKGFALSMIESAIELTDGEIKTTDIGQILDITKDMITADIQLIDHVSETLTQLATTHTLMLLTKGDLVDQESKIARSGLATHFHHIEIVSRKRPADYQTILSRYQIQPSRFVMIGNSLKSDILPVLEIGGTAIFIPHAMTWAHEKADPPTEQASFHQINHFGELPTLLSQLH